MTRLTTFDEKPENYITWKTSFKTIVSELSVTHSEETNFLIRWLDQESVWHAKTIRWSLRSDPS